MIYCENCIYNNHCYYQNDLGCNELKACTKYIKSNWITKIQKLLHLKIPVK